jgi:citrate lyase subunit beta/citryl-CoA lyase
LLFAPGTKENVMAKALASDADAVILDLEDSVPTDSKAQARSLVAKALAAPRSGSQVATVRINAVDTGLHSEDLAAIVQPGLDAIILPKAETEKGVVGVASEIESLERAQGMKAGSVEILFQIETALGVYRCFDLLKASPRVAGLCFGSARDGDLQTDLGCAWSPEGLELLYARSKVLLDTRAAGRHLQALDGVFGDLNDEAQLVADSVLSARLGFTGRQAIHPKQIAPIRRAYAVPAVEAAYAEKVVAEFKAAESKGIAAITVDGKLVDYAMYKRALDTLKRVALDKN